MLDIPDSKEKISRIPDSGLPYMGRRINWVIGHSKSDMINKLVMFADAVLTVSSFFAYRWMKQ